MPTEKEVLDAQFRLAERRFAELKIRMANKGLIEPKDSGRVTIKDERIRIQD